MNFSNIMSYFKMNKKIVKTTTDLDVGRVRVHVFFVGGENCELAIKGTYNETGCSYYKDEKYDIKYEVSSAIEELNNYLEDINGRRHPGYLLGTNSIYYNLEYGIY